MILIFRLRFHQLPLIYLILLIENTDFFLGLYITRFIPIIICINNRYRLQKLQNIYFQNLIFTYLEYITCCIKILHIRFFHFRGQSRYIQNYLDRWWHIRTFYAWYRLLQYFVIYRYPEQKQLHWSFATSSRHILLTLNYFFSFEYQLLEKIEFETDKHA